MMILDQIGKFDVPYYVTGFFAVLIGLFIGLFRIYVGFDFLKPYPSLVRILGQIAIIQVFILLSAACLQPFMKYFELIEPGIQFGELLVTRDFFTLYYKTQLFSFMLLFVMELESILGPRFLKDYILGKYNRPTREHRILLFMDLRKSTTLTEQMGDEKYFHFINHIYRLLSKPLIFTGGEILKYVGDEVIVSWNYKQGIAFDNCLQFYHEFIKTIHQNEKMFLRKYGVIPEFKAGMHHGRLVAAYLGDVKKQLDFSGDVVNTTARIMDLAKHKDAEILISNELFYALDYEKYEVEKITDVVLKGKEGSMNLVGLNVTKYLMEGKA